MITRFQPGDVFGFFAFFVVTGYFEYHAIRDLRTELAQTERTQKIRGYLVGLVGILLFTVFVQLLLLLSLLGSKDFRWEGYLFGISIGLILLGFFLGNRRIGQIRKQRAQAATMSGGSNARKKQ